MGPRKAFQRKGLPTDDAVFRDTKQLVARHTDVMHPDNLAGQSLQLTCCPASIRNVCKVQLAASGQGLVELHAQVVKSLNSCADRWGKSRCNESRILLMAECVLSTGDVARHFGLLARAWFNPKWQLWCSVEHVGPVPAVLAPPFVVRLVGEPTRICPAKQGLAVRTGDDFAELVARSSLGGRFSFVEVRYHMPTDEAHLLSMCVDGMDELDLAAFARRGPRNQPLSDLRSLAAPVMKEGARRLATRRPLGAPRGGSQVAPRDAPAQAREGNVEQPIGDSMPAMLAEPLVGGDEVPMDALAELEAEDLEEVLEAHGHWVDDPGARHEDEAMVELPPPAEDVAILAALPEGAEVGDGDVAREGAPGPEPDILQQPGDVAAEPAPPPPDPAAPMPPADAGPDWLAHISGPSASGFIRDRRVNRQIAKISPVFN